MKQARKELKVYSIVVLLYVIGEIFRLIFQLILEDFSDAPIPEGSPENVLLIAKIVFGVIASVIMLPQIYVGIKGLMVAKNPTSSERHIFWAKVLFVISLISTVITALSLIEPGNTFDDIGNTMIAALEAFVYYDYIRYAKIVAKEA